MDELSNVLPIPLRQDPADPRQSYISQSRPRMISFRVSEEEYRALRSVCSRCDNYTLSQIARYAIQCLIAGHIDLPDTALRQKVAELEERVADLDRKIDRLRQS